MGTIQIDGSTPKLTIGNATAEDALIVFDGNAQDFYIGLDDSADDLVIGLGSAAGTTPAISINEDRDVTISDGAIDFDVASHDTSNGLKLGGTLVTATAAELNIMDGVTSTAAEINLIDGGTARGTTALADGDGILINDAGTMRMTNVTAVKTYMATAALAGIDDQTSSNDDQLTITDSEVVINEDSDDLDFRVESNGNANMLFVDGGANLVGIAGDPDLGSALHIRTSDTGASVSNNAPQLVIEHGTSNEQTGISILSANDMLGNIFFGDDGDDDIGRIRYNHSENSLAFTANGSEKMRINTHGAVLINTTGNVAGGASNTTKLQVELDGQSVNVFSINNSASTSPLGMSINYNNVSGGNGSAWFDCQDGDNRRFIIDGNGNAKNTNNSYGAISDERLKENITDANSQWEDVKKFKFKNFNKKGDTTTQLGVVAQDLETDGMSGLVEEENPNRHDIRNNLVFGTLYEEGDVIPEDKKVGDIKTTTGEKVKAVKYSVLLLKSTKALQEAQTRIETLEAKVTALENA